MVDMSSPITLPSGQVLKNRIVKSAMSERLADENGLPSEALLKLYETWGKGGSGLLITGNAMIDARYKTEPENIVVDDPASLEKFREWAEVAQKNGSQLWMQINHPGRQMPKAVAAEAQAPSAVVVKGLGPLLAKPRAMTEEEILIAIEKYAKGALVAKESGFAGVQIHGAHGYLVSQFLSPISNRREDRWGGSLENRMRFLIEITRAIREKVGPDFPIGLKLNSADFQKGGFTNEESIAVIERLNSESIDLLEISGGTYERTEMWRNMHEKSAPSTRKREAYFLEYAEQVRAKAKMPLLLTGGLRSIEGINGALESGAIDVVGMARPFLINPNIAADFIEKKQSSIADPNLSVGIKTADSLIQITWYALQIERLGKGLQPDPNLSRLSAFCHGLMHSLPIFNKRASKARKPATASV